ncbi:hypothetical protein ASG11_09940 [Sphingomonas sp. Leaf357]|uniref:hypothetical protein n=1 Tax=Sphingomonas sp. Leaf357 TaxID=1736350 RepID=UPI0006F20E60|nr:hypothetical protein [Sphingomonas sp. Leaf357]KQS04531.1 hypothetical protein ASG11_09940 [Sphingomonas sp. Leaf357]
MAPLESPTAAKPRGKAYWRINLFVSAPAMTTMLNDLRRNAEQIERVLTGINDDESIRALREYASELDAEIERMRFADD